MFNTLILAAGLGTRLSPLTNRIAKPLIPIVNSSPLEKQIKLAKELGTKKIHVNAHHLAGQIQKAATELGVNKVWVETELLGTGGPIYRIQKEDEENECGELLILNGDCEHNLDVKLFLEEAKSSGAICALLAIDNKNVNTLCINKENLLCGIKNKFGADGTKNATFTGISWYSEKALKMLNENERDIRDFWKKLCENNYAPFVCITKGNWLDIGTPGTLMEAIDNEITKKGFEAMQTAGSAGSGRMYYRMQSGGHSLILQQSHSKDLDFERFVSYGKLFNNLKLPVPEIYAVDNINKRVVMQDAGTLRLYDVAQPLIYYPEVLAKLITWQEKSTEVFEQNSELAGRVFDEKDYLWESSYFTENYLQNHLKKYTITNEIPKELTEFFKTIAKKAAKQQRVLMHRDFQSQNIMLKNEIIFIDFQGARNGSIYYDVASLLFDPYMRFSKETIENLFKLWHSANPLLKNIPFKNALEEFLIAGAQRVMQALGAYCFLSKQKKIQSFEQYIKPAEKQLKMLCEEFTSPHSICFEHLLNAMRL